MRVTWMIHPFTSDLQLIIIRVRFYIGSFVESCCLQVVGDHHQQSLCTCLYRNHVKKRHAQTQFRAVTRSAGTWQRNIRNFLKALFFAFAESLTCFFMRVKNCVFFMLFLRKLSLFFTEALLNASQSRELELAVYWKDWRAMSAVKFLRLEDFLDNKHHGMALQLEPKGILFAEVS